MPDYIPTLTISLTDAQVTNQGYTYNQPGFTYNQPGVTYGGLYNVNQDVIPILSLAETINPKVTIQDTLAKVTNQGYTYNQAGFTYNQVGVSYGGIYNLFDITPIVSMAKQVITRIAGYSDAYTVVEPNQGMQAPGWFLYINLD